MWMVWLGDCFTLYGPFIIAQPLQKMKKMVLDYIIYPVPVAWYVCNYQ